MEICNENKCTGCCACINICPKNCIKMTENSSGEIYPVVDNDKCIGCSMCQRTCPANNESDFNEIKKCFVAHDLNNDYITASASGGASAVFSEVMIESNGVVFGAMYNEELNVVHGKATTLEESRKFKNSKYVQSYIGNTFFQVKEALNQNKRVLFVGTPCQIDGLKRYIGKENENLITADLICHGTPPSRYFRDYIDYIKEKKKIDVDLASFRGSDGLVLKLFYKDKIVFRNPYEKDVYYYGFEEGLFLRESCYNCKYTQKDRVSDITIGDFWGLGNIASIDYEVKKPSVILINTDKGQGFFNECKSKLFYKERPINEAIRGNGRLNESTPKSKDTERFKDFYKEYGFIGAIDKIELKKQMNKKFRNDKIKRYKTFMKKAIKYPIKKILRI